MKKLLFIVPIFMTLWISCSKTPVIPEDLAMYKGDIYHTGVLDTAPIVEKPEILWEFSIDGAIRTSPIIYDDMVLFGGMDGNYYGLDRNSGEKLWSYSMEKPCNSSASASDGVVYFVGDNRDLYALDVYTGEEVWVYRSEQISSIRNQPWDFFDSSPLVTQELVYFSDGEGKCIAVDRSSGESVWVYDPYPNAKDRSGMYVGNNAPALIGNSLLFTSATGIHCVDARKGELLWKIGESSIQTAPVIAENLVLFGGMSTELKAVDVETSEQLWAYDADLSWVTSTPALYNGRAYFGSSDGRHFWGVDLDSGEEVFAYYLGNRMFSSPTIAGGISYFGDDGGVLHALNLDTEELQWKWEGDSAIRSSVVIYEEICYFGTDNGRFIALQ